MQIHEITRKPLNELTNMPTATGTSPMKVTYGSGFAKPPVSTSTTAGTAAPATASGAAPAVPPPMAPAAKSSGAAGALGKIAGGTAAVAGGIGSALGKSLMSKAFGGVDVMGKNGTAQSREDLIKSQVNSPEARTLSTTMQAAWAQTVQNFLAHSKDANGNPAASIKNVTQPSVDSLQQELHNLVNRMISGRNSNADYTTMANYVKDPVVKQGIQEVTQRITEYVNAIYKATVQGADPKVIATAWMKLVGDGILPAQNSLAYDRTGGVAGGSGAVGPAGFDLRYTGKPAPNDLVINFGRGWEAFNDSNPQHKAAADAAGIKRP